MSEPLNPVKAVDTAFYYIFGVSGILFILIMAAMVFFVIKYRRSKHPIASENRGHTGLELAWTIIPSIIALSMFWLGWQSYLGLRTIPANAITIKVEAQQFGWVFTYPNNKVSKDLMIVPEKKPIKLEVSSLDVLHSFYLPAYRVKIDAMPKRLSYAWFYPEKIEKFDIFCALYCGVGHADMMAKLEVVSAEEYDAWLNKAEEDSW